MTVSVANRIDSPTIPAIRFLQDAQPEGPWVITAIQPDGGTTTRTFMPGQESSLGSFIEQNDGSRNLYFTVNETQGRPSKKPSKSELQRALFLHADIDTPKVEGEAPHQTAVRIKSSKERGLRALTGYPRQPTLIVNSGNGLHAYWRLDQPFELDTSEDIEAVESRNRALAKALGGDQTVANIDRILRLPGTRNLPTSRKARCGFAEAETSVIKSTDLDYPLSAFPLDLIKDSNGCGAGEIVGGTKANGFGDLPHVDIDTLPVSPRVKQMIRAGEDPDDKLEDKSRSGAMWAVLLAMVGARCSDGEIAAIMLDPTLPIGAHLRDLPNAKQKLAEQIAKARQHVGADQKAGKTREAPEIICCADVVPQPIRWLWPERIALGKLTLIALNAFLWN